MDKKELKKNKRRTKIGLIEQIYYNQKIHSKHRGHIPPTYSKQDLIDWCFAQSIFHLLYDNWKRLDFQKQYVPSVDRKDDYIGYTISNIQIMTWSKNKLKGEFDKKNGINNKNNKSVLQFTKSGEFVSEYYSIAKATRDTKILHISECCNGKIKTAGGFLWEYKEKK